MEILFILNDAPYGTEKSYNGLRLALSTLKETEDVSVKVFLMADAIFCGLKNQKTPDGYYNTERYIKSIIKRGGEVKSCGTCCEARGVTQEMLIDKVEISNLKTLTEWTVNADKVVTF
ncbi:MAG: DsrE family protein [Calditrichia bacterium]